MAGQNDKKRVFLSAAEVSGDNHCANLITALKQSGCDIDFVGIGGDRMASAGCELLENTVVRAVMIYKTFRHIGYYLRLIRRISNYFKSNRVDLVVVCDSPSLNFHVARSAKKTGIKTLFYVAPQLWAWAGWRMRKLRKYCDKLACILPFEQEWFSRRGVPAVFVGNPLLDNLDAVSAAKAKDYGDFDPSRAKIAILPGSRQAEVEGLWKPMQRIAVRLKEKFADIEFTAAAVDEQAKAALQSEEVEGFECEYVVGSVRQVVGGADFALVASGSVTLQVAAAGSPMVIMYQSSRVLWYLIGWWLVRSRYLSLVNILAGKELVPEFMPYFGSIEPIVGRCAELLNDRAKLAKTSAELIELVEPLAVKRASDQVAQMVAEMLGAKGRSN